jgi:hypothetical protein
MSKWIPLGFYESAGTHRLVLAKRIFTGMIRFRVKVISGKFHLSLFAPPKLNVDEQWQKIVGGK